MVFIQCSLAGIALSWFIRLNDTYKQDWHDFVQAFEKQFSSQKNALKDFANKRQRKHTSFVLEYSIPFHTLVKLVNAEDIANDKTRTYYVTLEVTNITKQLQTQTLDSSYLEQLMFTQPRDLNEKRKKKIHFPNSAG